jgi:hypothetical protein
VLDSVAEDDTTDAAETVDANLDGSHCELSVQEGQWSAGERQ